MSVPMWWFLPIGASIGLFGTRTASVEKRSRGGRWRFDTVLLVTLAWLPTLLWFAACAVAPFQ